MFKSTPCILEEVTEEGGQSVPIRNMCQIDDQHFSHQDNPFVGLLYNDSTGKEKLQNNLPCSRNGVKGRAIVNVTVKLDAFCGVQIAP